MTWLQSCPNFSRCVSLFASDWVHEFTSIGLNTVSLVVGLEFGNQFLSIRLGAVLLEVSNIASCSSNNFTIFNAEMPCTELHTNEVCNEFLAKIIDLFIFCKVPEFFIKCSSILNAFKCFSHVNYHFANKRLLWFDFSVLMKAVVETPNILADESMSKLNHACWSSFHYIEEGIPWNNVSNQLENILVVWFLQVSPLRLWWLSTKFLHVIQVFFTDL